MKDTDKINTRIEALLFLKENQNGKISDLEVIDEILLKEFKQAGYFIFNRDYYELDKKTFNEVDYILSLMKENEPRKRGFFGR